MPASSTKSNLVDAPCAFCGGTGLDPFGIMSWLSTCCVCGGEGVVKAFAPYVPCAHCRGSGAVKTLTCTVCGGKGVVSLPDVPVDVCPECRGTGDDASASAMDCLKCHGRGFVPQMTDDVKITQMS